MESTHIFNALLKNPHMFDFLEDIILQRVRHQILGVLRNTLAYKLQMAYFLLFLNAESFSEFEEGFFIWFM